ncbi:MAG: KamA family radical SAM protein [Desulfosudaceae bacterium]
MSRYWQELLAASVTGISGLPDHLRPVDKVGSEAAGRFYPLRINRYYAGLIRHPDDALGRQVIPDGRELKDAVYDDDPLAEANQSPVPGIIHRYPDRVIFLCSASCPVFCRFCMRKRLAGKTAALTEDQVDKALAYIRSQGSVREVILSGGDPLLLEDNVLDFLLAKIRAMDHVDQIRVHSRTPSALPQRITPDLAGILGRYHPLYLNIHVNHPDEVTAAMATACARLADVGIPLGSQTVLLKDINDTAAIMEKLWRSLLRIRVRPYYLHHPDLVRGTAHFRMPVEVGLDIMRALQGRLTGSALPRYMIDLPGGGGKVPLQPDYVQGRRQNMLMVKNYQGKSFTYPAKA